VGARRWGLSAERKRITKMGTTIVVFAPHQSALLAPSQQPHRPDVVGTPVRVTFGTIS
jgi:hypothetical protein